MIELSIVVALRIDASLCTTSPMPVHHDLNIGLSSAL